LLSRIPIADRNLYFVKLDQLIFPRWGFGVPTDLNGFSYQLGLAHLAIVAFIVLVLLFYLINGTKYFKDYPIKITYVLTVIVAFYIFLLFKPSEFLWESMPLLSEINYPWVILGILGFLISLLVGFLSKQSVGKYIVIALGLLAIFTVFPYAGPQYKIDKGDNYYITNSATTTSSDELMPLWVTKKPFQRSMKKAEIIKGNGSISNVYYNSKEIKLSVNVLSQNTVRINTIFYPGWKAYIDGKETEIKYNNESGVMEIAIKNGEHVKFVFSETPLRLFSDVVSILSFIVLIALMKFKYGNFKK